MSRLGSRTPGGPTKIFHFVHHRGKPAYAILTAALYLYAADGKVPQNFDNALLKNAFARK